MNESEAFEVLDLETTASGEAIKERYRELAQEIHPDKEGEENEFIRLLKAKRVALGEEPVELDTVEQTIDDYTQLVLYRQEKREESNKTVDRIIRHQTSKYRRKKQMTVVIGGILGVITVWMTFFDVPLLSGSSTLPGIVISLYIVAIGTMYWMFHVQTENISTLLTEADEALENNRVLKNILYEIGMYGRSHSEFTQQEFVENVKEWANEESSYDPFRSTVSIFLPPELDLRKLAKTVGATDFSKLLIRRGLAKDLIVEDESFEDGVFSVNYRINESEFGANS